MLPEWLESLLTPRPGAVRALPYLRELRNIRKRYLRWRAEWEPHCRRTRAVLLAAASRCRQQRKAVLFGTGYLHDIPLAELATLFREVILVDVLHPIAARWQVFLARRRWGHNIRLVSADITATVEAVRQAGRSPGSPLPVSLPTLFLEDPEIDLVASVNLLSQLPCMPERYLLGLGSHAEEAIVAYARNVITAHLAWLRTFPAVAALIADVEATTLSLQGEVVRTVNTLYGLEPDWQGETWTWSLVPCAPRPPHEATRLRVVATPQLRAAASAAAPNRRDSHR
jgi:hypothetical protein